MQVCSNKPVKECATVPKTVFKKLPDTTCERIPFEACAPDNCEYNLNNLDLNLNTTGERIWDII